MVHSPAARQLGSLAEEFAAVRAKFSALETRVSQADWGRRPSPAEWSVAECLAHLNLTSAAMVPPIRKALNVARTIPGVASRQYSQRWIGRILASMIGPVRIVASFKLGKIHTPPPFVPGRELPCASVCEEFHRWQEEELQLVRDAAGLAIDQVQVESPFKAGMFYDGYSALVILPRHEMRHLVQAERALEALSR